MCNLICGITTLVIGTVLVLVTTIVGFAVVPGIITNVIENEVILLEDTVQMERFEQVPFPLHFSVKLWNISNAEEVLNGGVPIMRDHGPYIYRLHHNRVVSNLGEDNITYRIMQHFEFDVEASYPYTEDDLVTVANVPYNAILQVAESLFPALMPVLNTGLNGIFGQYNSPIMEVRVRDLLFDSISICSNPGLVGLVACMQVRELSEGSQNMVVQDDGSISFSLLGYKDGIPSSEYVAHRGITDTVDLARIILYNNLPHLKYWTNENEDEISYCNMLNGTDSGIFNPFVDTEHPLYALNTDICSRITDEGIYFYGRILYYNVPPYRILIFCVLFVIESVELRYQHDVDYEGIPAVRFAANEWFLNDDDGCFCLNVTTGINGEYGCLLRGAVELYSCTGAFMVLTYPHFLYADPTYRNLLIGMNPSEEDHRIFLDLEPNTGTVVRGRKRGQFNIFLRPITGIAATQNLRTTLTPIFWVEEGIDLPLDFVDEIKSRLLASLNLVDILVPVLVAVSCVIFLIGIICVVRVKTRKSNDFATDSRPTPRGDSSFK